MDDPPHRRIRSPNTLPHATIKYIEGGTCQDYYINYCYQLTAIINRIDTNASNDM